MESYDIIRDNQGEMHPMRHSDGQCDRHGASSDCLSRLMMFGFTDTGIRVTETTQAQQLGRTYPARGENGTVCGWWAYDGHKKVPYVAPFPTEQECVDWMDGFILNGKARFGAVFTSRGNIIREAVA